jgi:VCBS repeat-containing protein
VVDFTYTVEDKLGNELEAPVEVTVTPVNEAPDASDDTTNTPQDTPVTINVLGNDTDPDGDALTITAVNGSPITEGGAPVAVADGTVSLIGGQLVFTPAPGFTGAANFSYTVQDPAGESDNAGVTVNVGVNNQAPVAQPDTNATDEDTTLTVNAANGVIQSAGQLSGVDSDPDGDTLAVTEVNGDAALVGQPIVGTYGTLVLNPDGSYTYTPTTAAQALPAGQFADDVFNYTVADPSGQSVSTTLTITVTGLNDAPVAVNNTSITAPNTPVSGNVLTDDGNGATAGGVDYDPDTGDVLTVTGFEVDTDGDGTPESFAPGATATIPNVGTLVIDATGAYTFTPAAGFEGAVPVVSYTISDGTASDSANLNILVDAANDPPVAVDDVVRGQEDQPVSFDPRTNDVDPEGEPLTITEVNGQPIVVNTPITITDPVSGETVGSMNLNPDGTLTFTPVANYNNSVPLPVAYTVLDPDGETATATININIAPVNDAPVDPNDTNTVVEDTPLVVPAASGLLGGSSDPDGDSLTITGFTVPGVTGTQAPGTPVTIPGVGVVTIDADGGYSFVPEPNFNGSIPVITYTVSDGNGGTDTSTLALTLTPVNDAPVDPDDVNTVTEDTPLTVDAASGLLNGATDVEGSALSVSGFTVPGLTGTQAIGVPVAIPGVGSITINSDGSYSFTPLPNFDGAIPVITYTVSDGNGGTDTSTLTLTMVPVNDAPVAADDGPVNVPFNTPVSGNVLPNDSDPDGDPLSVTGFSVAGDPTVYPPGTVAVIGGVGTLVIGADGTYTFTPVTGYAGPVPSAVYTITDGTFTDTAVLSFSNVVAPAPAPAPAPDAPVVVAPPVVAAPTPETVTDVPNSPDRGTSADSLSPAQTYVQPTSSALYVLYAVNDAQNERDLFATTLGGIQGGTALRSEALGMVPDNLIFSGAGQGSDLGLIRERGYGEMAVVDPALYVQHAVRYQPLDMDHALYVQHAVRAAQLESAIRSAAADASNSSTPGYATLFDAFATDAPATLLAAATAEATEAARQLAEGSGADKAVAAKAETTTEREAAKAGSDLLAMAEVPAKDKARAESVRPAPGFRAQLDRLAKDRSQGARPVTRATVKA